MGLELALDGEVIWQVEVDDYARQVLEKHWPGADRSVRDIRQAKDLQHVDLLCGGFPCQGLSVAGKGEGLKDQRSGLWFEMLRVIREIRPPIVVLENVPAIRTRGLDTVLAGLASLGYDAQWGVCGAADVGAPIEDNDGTASPIYPTPSAQTYGSNKGGAAGREGKTRHSLNSMARHGMWPTPIASDGLKYPTNSLARVIQCGGPTNRRDGTPRQWPTPRASDHRSGSVSDETHNKNSRPLCEQVGAAQKGMLNADWVELLMGFPLGYTKVTR